MQRSPARIEEMITTALKIARDEMTLADLQLIKTRIVPVVPLERRPIWRFGQLIDAINSSGPG